MGSHLVIIGKTGQLAKALQKEIDGTKHTASFYDRSSLDLRTNAKTIAKFVESLPPCDALILAAAYTAVDQAETDKKTAIAVNGHAPGIIAKVCKVRNIPLIHISTDYVFNGRSKTPYKVSDATDPINVYGYSKRLGELAIQSSGCRYAIVRTSWLYDGLGKNFLTTMLRLAENKNEISVVDDQIGRPTYTGHLAKSVLSIADRFMSGKKIHCSVFHVSNAGSIISWADFAKTIFEFQNLTTEVTPITTQNFPTLALRPAYSALDTSKFETSFDYTLPNWQEGLAAALTERLQLGST